MSINVIGANGEDIRLTLTIQNWLSNKLYDNFFGHNPFFYKLKAKGQVVKGGLGNQLRIPLKYPSPDRPIAEGVNDPYAALSFQPIGGLTSSLWEWAEYAMPISVPLRELKLQGSLTKKVDYMASIMEISMDSFADKLRQHMFAPENDPLSAGASTRLASFRTLFNKGGSATTGPYSPFPRPAQLSQSDATWGNAAVTSGTPVYTVGGINRNAAGNAYFCVPVKNPSVAESFGKTAINNLITLATRQNDKPDLGILYSNHYDVLMGILQQQRLISDSKMTDAGFESFSWRGVDFIFDDDVPLAAPGINAWIVNTKALELHVDTMEPEVKEKDSPDQLIKSWIAMWYGQLVMKNMGRGSGARHANLAP